MMKTRFILISACLLFSVFFSCKEEGYEMYHGEARLQFGPDPSLIYNSSNQLSDTVRTFTFFYDFTGKTRDTVYFNLYAVGGPKNQDRPFELEQVQLQQAENAIAGKHYVAFSDPSMENAYSMPAGQTNMRVPIVMLRDEELKSKKVKLLFRIKENAHFKLGQEDLLWRRLEFSDMIDQPKQWSGDDEKYVWGPYSREKHRFMISSTGELWDEEFFTILARDFGLRNFWWDKLKLALEQYKQAHGGQEKLDENLKPIKFPR